VEALLNALREDQIFLLAVLLLGGCSAKLARAARTGAMDDGLSPTTLFPTQMRKPIALAVCVLEGGLGAGLIVTAGKFGHGLPDNAIRICTALLFAVATAALVELRSVRPDVGCGCFGDFSTAPVSGRTVARAALLFLAAFSTIRLGPISMPDTHGAVLLVVIMVVELVVLGALSPELGEALVSLGYIEPCELKALPAERTLAALHRSKHWRRHGWLLLSEKPTDVWRELCWRYVVLPAHCPGRNCDVVFAVFLRHRRPVIHAALVDAMTGEPLPWPARERRRGRPRLRRLAPAPWTGGVMATQTQSQPRPARLDMPVSSDL
jgi:hypothetical protein